MWRTPDFHKSEPKKMGRGHGFNVLHEHFEISKKFHPFVTLESMQKRRKEGHSMKRKNKTTNYGGEGDKKLRIEIDNWNTIKKSVEDKFHPGCTLYMLRGQMIHPDQYWMHSPGSLGCWLPFSVTLQYPVNIHCENEVKIEQTN